MNGTMQDVAHKRVNPVQERLVVCFDVVTLCKFKVLKGTTERLMYSGQAAPWYSCLGDGRLTQKCSVLSAGGGWGYWKFYVQFAVWWLWQLWWHWWWWWWRRWWLVNLYPTGKRMWKTPFPPSQSNELI